MYIILNGLVIQIGIIITALTVLDGKTFEIHPLSYFRIYWYSLLTIVTSALQ